MPLQITYAGYALHENGIAHFGRSMSPDDAENPALLTEAIKVQMRFFESNFADNTAKWAALQLVLRNNPRGLLVITDEAGTEHFSRTVKFAGHDGTPEWGEFRREVSLTFEVQTGAGVITAQSATFTPAGGLPITLPNISEWGGSKKNDRPSTHSPVRNEQRETVTASGKWSPPGNPDDEARRDALLAKRDEINAAANCAEGALTWRGSTQVMQVEALTATVGDGLKELTWSLSCFRRVFPEGNYAESDYTVDSAEDREEGRRLTTVSGKTVAGSEGQARAEAERIRAVYATGRIYLKSQTGCHVIEGTDGSDPCTELSFSHTFREIMDVVSFKLKVATGTDTRTGDRTVTYSGSVVALTYAAALAKAREIGGGFDSTSLFLLSRSEDEDAVSVSGQALEGVSVTFSYTYTGKAAVPFADVTMEVSEDFFGGKTTTVSGTVAATDKATAVAFARQFLIVGVIMLSQRESDGKLVKDTLGKTLFKTMDFSYSYGGALTRTTISYGREVAHDYSELTTNVTYSGTAYGLGISQCDTLINSIVSSGGTKQTDKRTDDWKYDGDNGLGLFVQRPFSISFTMPITAADASGITIIEAAYTLSIDYGLWQAAIDEIPYGAPWVQENVYLSCGLVTVNGSVSSKTEAAGVAWARDKADLCTGYLHKAEVGTTFTFQKRSGTVVRIYATGFSFASKDPSKVW